MNEKTVSVIIPVYNEAAYIGECLESVIASCEGMRTEVLVVDGGSNDATRAVVETCKKRFPVIRLLENPDRITPVAMNIGIAASKHDYIFILSAHAHYPADYCRELVRYCDLLDATCVGPALDTAVKNETAVSCAIRNVLSDRLGVGGGFRSGVTEIKETDTVPFGCYRREAFERFGLFDERLVRNQDIELNRRIVNGGGRICIIPEIRCTYYAREHFSGLASNNFANGTWNLLTAFYTRSLRSLSLKHYVPLLFLLAIVFPLLAGAWQVSAGILAIYFAIIAARARQIAVKTTWAHQTWAFAVLHFSYACGEAAGIMVGIKHILFDKERL